MFFGGGTPSLLPAELVLAVLEAVSDRIGLAAGAEVTVECNPETVTADKLAAYRAGGVTRLSFGVQSMVPHVLAALGREHEPASVRRALTWRERPGSRGLQRRPDLRGRRRDDGGLGGIAGDVLPRPPSCSRERLRLTVEPGTPLATQRDRHPSEDDQADKYVMACSWLSDAGFEWYEDLELGTTWVLVAPTTFSTGHRANIGAWAVPLDSHVALPDGSARRWWNVRTPERYCRLVEAGEPVEAAGETLGAEQRPWEALALSLRTSRGVPASAVPDELFDEGLVELHEDDRGGTDGESRLAAGLAIGRC